MYEPGADVDVQRTGNIPGVLGHQCDVGSHVRTWQAPCSMETVDPNFKDPKSVQWNVDLQRALTNSLTLDVAYVGVHGYDETRSVDLNEAPVGVGWDNSAIFSTTGQTCLGTDPASPVVPTQSSLTTLYCRRCR